MHILDELKVFLTDSLQEEHVSEELRKQAQLLEVKLANATGATRYHVNAFDQHIADVRSDDVAHDVAKRMSKTQPQFCYHVSSSRVVETTVATYSNGKQVR
jgi:hypothetical protein